MSFLRRNIRKLPAPLFRTLNYSAILFEPVLNRMGINLRRRPTEARDPYFGVSGAALRSIELEVLADRPRLLQIDKVRKMLAAERARQLLPASDDAVAVAHATSDVAYYSVDHNLQAARVSAGEDRPFVMVKVVSAIQRVQNKIDQLEVLSIGPRSEVEIFGILSAGFSQDRIKAVDLFSYSPFVEVGDAHEMTYPDDSFDVVFLGWVLPYSRNQKRMAKEIIRVCRPGAIVAVAGDHSPPTQTSERFNHENTPVTDTKTILGLFEGNLGHVYFRHEATSPEAPMVMTVFEIVK